MRHYYLLLGLLMLGCVFEEPDKTEKKGITYEITNDTNTVARRVFDQCVLQYSFRNSGRTLDVNTILKQLEIPFDRWAQANGYLSFERVSANDRAEISFIFADSLPLKEPENYTDLGLIGQSIKGISQLVRQADGTCTIYLRNTHAWNPAELQRTLLFQIGAALGLANSSRSTSAMRSQLNTTAQPDSLDASAIQQLYNQPCDRWTRLADLPFISSSVETYVASTTRGYVLLNVSRNNALWEFNPVTKGWNARLAYPAAPTTTIFRNNWLAFAIDSTVFIGEGYNSKWNAGQKGTFWRYVSADNPTGERWVKLDSIPQVGWVAGYAFTLNKIGYVLTLNNVAGKQMLSVCPYDPVLNKWGKASLYEQPKLFTISSLLPFGLGADAYLITTSGFYKSWRFSPNQLSAFTETPSVDGNSNMAMFSIRNAGYGVTGAYYGPKNVWRYKPEQGWKPMNNVAIQGDPTFSFTVGNRAYVGTSTGQFWEYRP